MKASSPYRMNSVKCLMIVWGILTSQLSLASEVPSSFTYQGRLFATDGTTPLTSNVDFKLQIYDPTATCLLYEESQENISLTDGLFSISVGSNIGNIRRGPNDPGLSMSTIFSNQSSAVRSIGAANCVSGYTPGSGDKRKLKVTVFNRNSGESVILTPLKELSMNPYSLISSQAVDSKKLDGKTSSQFIQTSSNISQSSLESWMSSSALSQLLGGTYMPSGLAPIATTGSASSLTTGTVPMNLLGSSGTRDASTYLRGDGTWATPSGGGGSLTSGDVTSALGFTPQAQNSDLSAIGSLALTGILQRNGSGSYSTLGLTAPLNVTLGNIGMTQANSTTSGYLSSSDWNLFNSKLSSISSANVTTALGFTPLSANSNLSDLTSAASARTNLELGNSATKNTGSAAGTVAAGDDARFPSGTCSAGNKMRWDGSAWQCEAEAGGASFNKGTLTFSSSIPVDLMGKDAIEVTLTGNATLENPTNGIDGKTYTIIVKQDASGGRTISWGSDYLFDQDLTNSLPSTPNDYGIFRYTYYASKMHLTSRHLKSTICSNTSKFYFDYKDTGVQTISVPANCTSMTIKAWGAAGGGGGSGCGTGTGAGGGYVTAAYSISPGTSLSVIVGGGGLNRSGGTSATDGYPSYYMPGAGFGGSSSGGALVAVHLTSDPTANGYFVAAGSGGGTCAGYAGGPGGGATGGTGGNFTTPYASGGTQSAGGTSAAGCSGDFLTGGIGNADSNSGNSDAAGGGAGWYGGAGGGSNGSTGGGGGSSYFSTALGYKASTGSTTGGTSSTPGNSSDSDRTTNYSPTTHYTSAPFTSSGPGAGNSSNYGSPGRVVIQFGN
jgi:hypothetical protein